MSETENFLARWSRLKREAALEMSGVDEPARAQALPVLAPPPAPAFDPANLPSIESIDATTDIRPFLEACVPEQLTRAALRSAWSADPAIRDFVGIAESQWDFNNPTAIPGFGVHVAADYLCSLAAQSSQMVEQQVPADTDPAGSRPADVVCGGHANSAEPLIQRSASEGDPGTQSVRSHGGALPR